MPQVTRVPARTTLRAGHDDLVAAEGQAAQHVTRLGEAYPVKDVARPDGIIDRNAVRQDLGPDGTVTLAVTADVSFADDVDRQPQPLVHRRGRDHRFPRVGHHLNLVIAGDQTIPGRTGRRRTPHQRVTEGRLGVRRYPTDRKRKTTLDPGCRRRDGTVTVPHTGFALRVDADQEGLVGNRYGAGALGDRTGNSVGGTVVVSILVLQRRGIRTKPDGTLVPQHPGNVETELKEHLVIRDRRGSGESTAVGHPDRPRRPVTSTAGRAVGDDDVRKVGVRAGQTGETEHGGIEGHLELEAQDVGKILHRYGNADVRPGKPRFEAEGQLQRVDAGRGPVVRNRRRTEFTAFFVADRDPVGTVPGYGVINGCVVIDLVGGRRHRSAGARRRFLDHDRVALPPAQLGRAAPDVEEAVTARRVGVGVHHLDGVEVGDAEGLVHRYVHARPPVLVDGVESHQVGIVEGDRGEIQHDGVTAKERRDGIVTTTVVSHESRVIPRRVVEGNRDGEFVEGKLTVIGYAGVGHDISQRSARYRRSAVVKGVAHSGGRCRIGVSRQVYGRGVHPHAELVLGAEEDRIRAGVEAPRVPRGDIVPEAVALHLKVQKPADLPGIVTVHLQKDVARLADLVRVVADRHRPLPEGGSGEEESESGED